jgi:arylsulfatase A-like enzyme
VRGATLGLVLAAAGACSPSPATPPEGPAPPPPTRGYIIISLDTLRADHLSAYGYEHETSPFLAELARRSVLFERVLAPYPATLVSHMSLFTGLYPQQHAVYPPNGVLSPEVPTLPEVLGAAGFRTAGFTEGGFVAGGFGFARGFERFADPPYQADTDIEATFARGIDFLGGVGSDERFFLFLHSYSVHDPYAPPEPWRERFAPADTGSAALSLGENLRDSNQGRLELPPGAVEDFRRLYDGTVAYVDGVLRDFFVALDEAGLAEEVTVLVTSDHGEEFREHERLGHTQLYPESLFVPLVVVQPHRREAVRVERLVRLVDVAPTVYDLARVEPPPGLAGESLAPCLVAADACAGRSAYAEVSDEERNRTLLVEEDGRLYQFHLVVYDSDPEGTWISRRATFDVHGPELAFESRSFHRPRTLRLLVGDEEIRRVEVGTDWGRHAVALPPAGRVRVTAEADGCDVPARVGEGDDSRCLSVILKGPLLTRSELYDLTEDPGATRDLSGELPAVHRRLARRLAELAWEPRAESLETTLTEQQREMLEALGYLD